MSDSGVASAPVSAFGKDNPFPARVTANRLLSKPGSAKETRHIVVDISGSGLTYTAGDSLGVYPVNRVSEVDEVLGLLQATGDEPVVLPKAAEPCRLRDALTSKLALAGPTSRILTTLLGKATNPAEQARLASLLAPDAKEALASFLSEREYVDVLWEFRSARLTPQEFVDHLRKLVPRLYSIASSPKLYPNEIHLTVAIVRYRTNNRDRVGVCSTFLADRVEVGATPTPVFVSSSHFGPPADTSRDVIMVGPGTGIAPFRAFLQDRVADRATGRNWIFFGDQKRATDFLYEDEWQEYLEDGQLSRLDLAWSRDQAHKIYVQDKMREHAAELWAWIKNGAYFFVCGDAKRMAKDVDAVLHEIVATQGGLEASAAAEYVKALKKEKRYQRDVY
ncbi:sulfite reductase subunit alpha [Opitutaceae bacterium EW11]|nr:sulfite reductase subunit alpha [Opitutaceae bacterium EW11]